MEAARCEVLRLLLTIAGESMYSTPALLPIEGVRSLTYLCTNPDKQAVLSVLCSLLNTVRSGTETYRRWNAQTMRTNTKQTQVLKYNPASWKVAYNPLTSKDPKEVLVTYALQLLSVLVLYPIPESTLLSSCSHDDSSRRPPPPPSSGPPIRNYYRHYCGRLHRAHDFQFIVDGMTRVLSAPLQDRSPYHLPSAQQTTVSGHLAPAFLMLFWEILQCNRRFRAFVIDTDRAHDLVVLALFYASDTSATLASSIGSRQGVGRMCAFMLQTLSVERNFGINLNKPFDAQDTLPLAVRITPFSGTHADFLIQVGV